MSAIATEGRENRLKFDERVGSYLVDGVAFILLNWILTKILDEAGGSFNMFSPGSALASKSVTLAFLLMFSTEIFLKASPGKLLLGQRICHQDGTDATMPALLIRYAVKAGGYLLILLALFLESGELYSLLSSLGMGAVGAYSIGTLLVLGISRMGLHDRISKTAVFKA